MGRYLRREQIIHILSAFSACAVNLLLEKVKKKQLMNSFIPAVPVQMKHSWVYLQIFFKNDRVCNLSSFLFYTVCL